MNGEIFERETIKKTGWLVTFIVFLFTYRYGTYVLGIYISHMNLTASCYYALR